MLTIGHTQIDAVLTTYRTFLSETIDSLAGAQGQVATLTADLAAVRASLKAAEDRITELTPHPAPDNAPGPLGPPPPSPSAEGIPGAPNPAPSF